MKPIRTVMTTLLVTGLASLGYARPLRVAPQGFHALAAGAAVQQDDQKPKDTPDSKPADKQDKPPKPPAADKHQTPDPHQTPDASKPEKPAKPAAPDKSQTRDDRNQNQDKQDKNVAKQDQRDDKGHPADNHPADNHADNGGGRRVADKDLKAHFGQEHKFSARQVVTTTTIVPNQTRFVYTGYTFVFADPWPTGWAVDDDCYIDYVDGEYYFIDLDHPGARIELTIVG